MEEITNALSAEEWAKMETEDASIQFDGELVLPDCSVESIPANRHGLAALALYKQTFGFTREDVTMLFGIAHHFQAYPGDRAYTDRIASIALRIRALLPPSP